MAHEELTEHPAGERHPLDTPFPYSLDLLQPSTPSPTRSSKEAALEFLLCQTGCQDVADLEDRSRKLQEETYQVWPYPCIRRWSFLTTKAAEQQVYEKALRLGRDPEAIFLELGCFFGTDSRRLVYDGWDSKRVIGTDLRSEWFEKGHELYRDHRTCPIRFIAGDIFDPNFLAPSSSSEDSQPQSTTAPDLQNPTTLNYLKGHVTAMCAFSFFHLFEETGQYELAKRVATLLSPKKGSIIFGAHQAGRVKAEIPRHNNIKSTRFVHSPESWMEMWETQIFPASRSSPSEERRTRVKASARLLGSQQEDPTKSSTMEWSVEVV